MEKKIKHLEFIQEIVKRMGSNSFMLKGWAVTLIAGIFALSDTNTDKMYFLVTYVPIIVFWFLDSYYLQQERLYRSLYDLVSVLDENSIDFSLKASLSKFNNEDNRFCNCLISKTEIGFYVPLAVVCSLVIIITNI